MQNENEMRELMLIMAFSDIGLRNAILDMRQQEETHIMENIIYNELITRGYSVDVGMVELKRQEKTASGFVFNLKWTLLPVSAVRSTMYSLPCQSLIGRKRYWNLAL